MERWQVFVVVFLFVMGAGLFLYNFPLVPELLSRLLKRDLSAQLPLPTRIVFFVFGIGFIGVGVYALIEAPTQGVVQRVASCPTCPPFATSKPCFTPVPTPVFLPSPTKMPLPTRTPVPSYTLTPTPIFTLTPTLTENTPLVGTVNEWKGVYIREEPSKDGKIVAVIFNATVQVDGRTRDGSWLRIKRIGASNEGQVIMMNPQYNMGDLSGKWISSQYVSLEGDSQNLPVRFSVPNGYIGTLERLNFRNCPVERDDTVVDTLKTGTFLKPDHIYSVFVDGEQWVWVKVKWGEKEGWVLWKEGSKVYIDDPHDILPTLLNSPSPPPCPTPVG